MAGAPKGNQNAAKARIMSKHLLARIEERKLWPELMDALLTKALEGDVPAIKEVFDRVDGKATQDINLGGPGGGALQITRIELVPMQAK